MGTRSIIGLVALLTAALFAVGFLVEPLPARAATTSPTALLLQS